MSTAAGGRNEPRYIDALASDVRTIDVGDEPSARPESSVNGGGAALAANFHRGHLESFGLRVEVPEACALAFMPSQAIMPDNAPFVPATACQSRAGQPPCALEKKYRRAPRAHPVRTPRHRQQQSPAHWQRSISTNSCTVFFHLQTGMARSGAERRWSSSHLRRIGAGLFHSISSVSYPFSARRCHLRRCRCVATTEKFTMLPIRVRRLEYLYTLHHRWRLLSAGHAVR